MKTIDEIRLETPLSVTTTDNPIVEIVEDLDAPLFEGKETEDGLRYNEYLETLVNIKKGTRLRLLVCDYTKKEAQYRWGDGNQFVVIDLIATKMIYEPLDTIFQR